MGMSLEKHCGNCEYVTCGTTNAPCAYCKEFSNWLPDSRMRNKYTPNQLRELKFGKPQPVPVIKDVIFNPPATIVKWGDGTKTVVKCQEGDEFDPEKALAMAIAKKAMGNTGSYFNHIKKWAEKYEANVITLDIPVLNFDGNALLELARRATADIARLSARIGSDPK